MRNEPSRTMDNELSPQLAKNVPAVNTITRPVTERAVGTSKGEFGYFAHTTSAERRVLSDKTEDGGTGDKDYRREDKGKPRDDNQTVFLKLRGAAGDYGSNV